jgi:hypothetical protein
MPRMPLSLVRGARRGRNVGSPQAPIESYPHTPPVVAPPTPVSPYPGNFAPPFDPQGPPPYIPGEPDIPSPYPPYPSYPGIPPGSPPYPPYPGIPGSPGIPPSPYQIPHPSGPLVLGGGATGMYNRNPLQRSQQSGLLGPSRQKALTMGSSNPTFR